MPVVNLVWYQSKVRKIMRNVRALNQTEIAKVQHITRQGVSNSMKRGRYEAELVDWIQILDLAGYEIVEKEK